MRGYGGVSNMSYFDSYIFYASFCNQFGVFLDFKVGHFGHMSVSKELRGEC